MQTLKNIVASAVDPAKAVVMAKKVHRRLFDPRGRISADSYRAWLQQHSVTMDAFLERFEPSLAADARRFSDEIGEHAREVLSRIPHDLGGGGGVPLLYLVTRKLRPQTVVETGVAAGFSSASFLAALEENGQGRLYSSDFPYFRIERPERFIGVVVPEHLKARWTLLVKGDQRNVPEILRQVDKVDVFHFDSDKSYIGRKLVVDQILPRMNRPSVFIMDDIQDNCYFHDLVVEQEIADFSVIAFEGKYIGYFELT